jgi:hypothetical protein
MYPVNNRTWRWTYSLFMNSLCNTRLCVFVLMVRLFHLPVFSTLCVYRSERNLSVFIMPRVYQSERNLSVFSKAYVYQSERNLSVFSTPCVYQSERNLCNLWA